MTLVIVITIGLLLIFGLFAAFIFRHVLRYGYLSPNFKIVVSIFGLMALAVIVFSFYLLTQLYRLQNPDSGSFFPSPSDASNNLNF